MLGIKDAIKRARDRLDEIITKGEKVLSTKRRPSAGYGGDYLDDEDGYTQWRMSSKTILQVLNPVGHYADEFEKIDTDTTSWSGPAGKLSEQLSVMKALRENFDGGYLSNIRGLIRAEVFVDFLDQAQHLLDESYWQPVPVIVGAVLEDHLRKLCAKYPTIVLAPKPGINAMNSELVRAQQYDALRKKQVDVWADLRNKAAHGEWSKFKPKDAEAMLRDVPAFLADNPT